MHVRPVSADTANDAVRAMYARDLAADDYIHNYTKLFSLNPAAWDAWLGLRASLQRMDPRRYELVTLAAAAALRCRYCVGAHAAVLESRFFERPQLEALARDYRTAGLDSVDVEAMALAETVALHADRVTPEQVDALRRHGLTDEEIFDVVLAASARALFSKTLDALAAEPDAPLAATSPIFELTQAGPMRVGHPR